MVGKHPFVKWAIKAIECYVKEGKIAEPDPDEIPIEYLKPLLEYSAGVFVSLHTTDGMLRGCIGTIEATKSSLALEIRDNAIASATRDPRFNAVQEYELEGIVVNVDILGLPEPVDDADELDVKKYGVIVESGYKRGLLLPDIEGVDSVKMQIDIAKRKAGIFPGEKFDIYKFVVERYF